MESTPGLRLSVLDSSCAARFVAVRAIRWGEVEAGFPVDEAPTLLIGQCVDLAFRGDGIQGLARIRGYVTQRVDEEGARIYGFQLDHGDGTALDAAVNRRASVRVTPDPAAPVQVVLRDASGRPATTTLLRDLSEGGLCVLVGREQEWLLAHADRVRIEMRLPGYEGVVALDGRIRHRRLERTAIHYGIRFEKAPAGAIDPREPIRAYIEERHRAMQARLVPDADAA